MSRARPEVPLAQRRTAMTTTAIGLFDGFSGVQRMIHTLVAQGIRSEDITIIANREETSVSEVLGAAAWGVNVDVGPASRGELAALIALGVPADEAQPYALVLDGGGTLLSVVAAEHQVDQVLALMGRSTTEDLAAPAGSSSPVNRWRPSTPPRTFVTLTLCSRDARRSS
jgi:hypothetical protein